MEVIVVTEHEDVLTPNASLILSIMPFEDEVAPDDAVADEQSA